MARFRFFAVVLPVLLLIACQSVGASVAAWEACSRAAGEYNGSVAGSYATTVGYIRRLGLSGEPARWPDLAPDHPAVLCYVDGQIAKGPPSPRDGQTAAASFDRAAVAVVDGHVELIIAGYRSNLPVRAP
jgi:hypothetical protein